MINIQKVDAAAIPIIRELAYITWQVTYKDMLPPGQVDYMLELFYSESSLKKQIDELHHQFIIATDNNDVAGFAAYSIKDDITAICRMHKIYIYPHHQRKGIGKRLVDFVIHDIKPNGAIQLELTVNRLNNAVNFYKKIGFEITGQEDRDIGNGYFMRDYIMMLNV